VVAIEAGDHRGRLARRVIRHRGMVPPYIVPRRARRDDDAGRSDPCEGERAAHGHARRGRPTPGSAPIPASPPSRPAIAIMMLNGRERHAEPHCKVG